MSRSRSLISIRISTRQTAPEAAMVPYLLEIQKHPIFFRLVGNMLGAGKRAPLLRRFSAAQLGRDKAGKEVLVSCPMNNFQKSL
jgi:hypothetical protein